MTDFDMSVSFTHELSTPYGMADEQFLREIKEAVDRTVSDIYNANITTYAQLRVTYISPTMVHIIVNVHAVDYDDDDDEEAILADPTREEMMCV